MVSCCYVKHTTWRTINFVLISGVGQCICPSFLEAKGTTEALLLRICSEIASQATSARITSPLPFTQSLSIDRCQTTLSDSPAEGMLPSIPCVRHSFTPLVSRFHLYSLGDGGPTRAYREGMRHMRTQTEKEDRKHTFGFLHRSLRYSFQTPAHTFGTSRHLTG